MYIGLGVVLIVLGAIFMWAIDFDMEFVDDRTLGLILLIAGILTIVLSLVLTAQRSRTTHVEERRYDQGDPYPRP
ncbi:MAG: hypothetical protein H0V02_00060 [Nocardioidaceae bacterium]|nr:hypothetical protein [Nocardioidaceae bacterium]